MYFKYFPKQQALKMFIYKKQQIFFMLTNWVKCFFLETINKY